MCIFPGVCLSVTQCVEVRHKCIKAGVLYASTYERTPVTSTLKTQHAPQPHYTLPHLNMKVVSTQMKWNVAHDNTVRVQRTIFTQGTIKHCNTVPWEKQPGHEDMQDTHTHTYVHMYVAANTM